MIDNVVLMPRPPQDVEADNATDNAQNKDMDNANTSLPIMTVDSAFRDATQEALDDYGTITQNDLAHTDCMIDLVADVLSRARVVLELQNSMMDKGTKITIPQRPIPWVYAMILARTDDYRSLIGVDGKTRTLVMRVRTGKDAGLVVPLDRGNARPLYRTIQRIAPTLTAREREEVRLILADMVAEVSETWDKDMVWCANGVYDYHVGDPAKRFTPYCLPDGTANPDYYARYSDMIITHKLAVDFVKDAPLVTYHNDADGTDWDVESGIAELFEDKVLEKFGWQILHFCVRQHNGGASIFAINRSGQAGGGGGKDTFANLMIGLLGGPGNVYRTPIEKWVKNPHELEGIVGKMGWISSESNAPTNPIDDCEPWKNLCRGQAISINAKYKSVASYVFHGIMYQMCNDVPMFRERSKSVFRCAECLPFEKDFHRDGSIPRDYIRDDYATRKETLEYVLYHALTMFDNEALESYTEDVRSYVAHLKTEMRATASKVWEYMDEIEHYLEDWMKERHEYKPDASLIIPHRLLYDIFSADRNGWCSAQGYGHTLNLKNFRRELMVWVEAHQDKWRYVPTSGKSFRIGFDGAGYSELLKCYPVEKWLNTRYRNTNDVQLITAMDSDMANKVYNGGIEYIG